MIKKVKQFILSDKQYEILKWTGLIFIPLGTLISTLATIWHSETPNAIGATLSAIGVFIGSMVALSNKNYNESEQHE